jgi:hypothetical protein
VSLLSQPLAVPSRIKGATQLLAGERGQRIKRDSAEALLSPPSLKGESENGDKLAMVRRTLDECVKLQLFLDDGGFLVLNPELSRESLTPANIRSVLPGIVLRLILNPSNDANHDLALALAWFMSQDALTAPSTWSAFGESWRVSGVSEVPAFNDTRYANLSYWARYLGLAQLVSTPVQGPNPENHLFPEPTVCLRKILREVFAGRANRLSIAQCLHQVSVRCAVFEQGSFRNRMERYGPTPEPKHLSSVTSLAFLRIEDEGLIRLEMRSDADAIVLIDGKERRPVSDVVLVDQSEQAP